MSLAIALAGWIAAIGGAGLALAASRRLSRRMEALARVSHELRGPITAAMLGLRLGELTPPRRRALELELGRAGLALEDLAAIGGQSGTARTLAPFDLRQLLSDSVEAWQPTAAERGVEVVLLWSGRDVLVLGERLRLAQAAENLIANAIEHGGGRVEVHGRAGPGKVRVEVRDQGPGLSAPVPELAKIARRQRPSRGRGLAIASAIVREHGGRLAAAPSVRGARLVVTLPVVGAVGETTRGSCA